jgi:hypothetical protein
MVATLFLVIPGIIVYCMLWVAVPVVVVERLGATGALSRSVNLTKQRLWRIFGVSLVLMLIGVLGGMVGSCFSRPVMMTGSQMGVVIGSLITYAISGAMSAIGAVASSVGYYFLRVEKGGIDLGDLLKVFE